MVKILERALDYHTSNLALKSFGSKIRGAEPDNTPLYLSYIGGKSQGPAETPTKPQNPPKTSLRGV